MINVSNDPQSYSRTVAKPELRTAFVNHVFSLMAVGLAITALVSFLVVRVESLMAIFLNPIALILLIVVQMVLVFSITGQVRSMKMAANTARNLFFLFSALTGATLSSLFLIYTAESIVSVFFIASGVFAAMAFFGYTTKTDLSRFAGLLFGALIALVVISIVNIFLGSSMLYTLASYFGVLVFMGMTAYDTQRIASMGDLFEEGTEMQGKLAAAAALSVYLNFINLFIYLLRIFGNRRD